jgi:hypothetical protein
MKNEQLYNQITRLVKSIYHGQYYRDHLHSTTGKLVETWRNQEIADLAVEIYKINKEVQMEGSRVDLFPFVPSEEKTAIDKEFVLLVKPEVTNTDEFEKSAFKSEPESTPLSGEDMFVVEILYVALTSILTTNLQVWGISIIGWEALRRENLVSRHFAEMERVARYGLQAPELSNRLAYLKKESPYAIQTELGAYQAKEKGYWDDYIQTEWHNQLSPDRYDEENSKTDNIASGVFFIPSSEYAKDFRRNISTYNGFYPFMKDFYERSGSSIIAFLVRSRPRFSESWSEIENYIVGGIIKRSPNFTLRGEIYYHHQRWGLKQFNNAQNGFECSRGILESVRSMLLWAGLPEALSGIASTIGGQKLLESGFNERQIKWMLSNPEVTYKENKSLLFDLLRYKENQEAISVLREIPEVKKKK